MVNAVGKVFNKIITEEVYKLTDKVLPLTMFGPQGGSLVISLSVKGGLNLKQVMICKAKLG